MGGGIAGNCVGRAAAGEATAKGDRLARLRPQQGFDEEERMLILAKVALRPAAVETACTWWP